jgi:hypothetical protein
VKKLLNILSKLNHLGFYCKLYFFDRKFRKVKNWNRKWVLITWPLVSELGAGSCEQDVNYIHTFVRRLALALHKCIFKMQLDLLAQCTNSIYDKETTQWQLKAEHCHFTRTYLGCTIAMIFTVRFVFLILVKKHRGKFDQFCNLTGDLFVPSREMPTWQMRSITAAFANLTYVHYIQSQGC